MFHLDAIQLGINRSSGRKKMNNGVKATGIEVGAPPQEMKHVAVFGVLLTVLQE